MKKLAAVSVLAAVLCTGAACGSGTPSNPTIIAGGSASPTPAPAPSATPIPVPVATPTPTPEPTESPEINDNDRPVEKVGAGVYYVECGGQILENSRSAREV